MLCKAVIGGWMMQCCFKGGAAVECSVRNQGYQRLHESSWKIPRAVYLCSDNISETPPAGYPTTHGVRHHRNANKVPSMSYRILPEG